jgi:hypothetical protein
MNRILDVSIILNPRAFSQTAAVVLGAGLIAAGAVSSGFARAPELVNGGASVNFLGDPTGGVFGAEEVVSGSSGALLATDGDPTGGVYGETGQPMPVPLGPLPGGVLVLPDPSTRNGWLDPSPFWREIREDGDSSTIWAGHGRF